MKIYLDNAATTRLDKEVFEAMEPCFFDGFANPSSAHAPGREARKAVEQARATIADTLHAEASEILFTSGGTEADNIAIYSAVRASGIRLVVTSPFEHHAVLNTLRTLEKNGEIKLVYLMHDERGNISLKHLESILAFNSRAFVTLMHGNNEIGNLNNIHLIGDLCRKYNALFHTDTVQTVGHYPLDLKSLPVDFITGSAHKFHGPKGVGFLYAGSRTTVLPLISGGGQENGRRAGTENVAGIIGLAKAIEIAYRDLDKDRAHITRLKRLMIEGLKSGVPGISFNGSSCDLEESLYTVLSVSLPSFPAMTTALLYLDNNHICASGGSACTAGSGHGSHVLKALSYNFERTAVRFSFGKYNTEDEIAYTVARLSDLYAQSTLKGLRIAV